MRFVLTIICLLASSLHTCATYPFDRPPPVHDRATTLSIAAALLPQFAEPVAGKHAVIFVSVGGADAPAEFLEAHSTSSVTLRPRSQYQAGDGSTTIEIREPRWLNATTVKVTVGRQLGAHMSYGTTYTMKWRGGAWAVESEAPAWIT